MGQGGEGGSSPLARGLLFHTPHPPSHVWIIPARAGFTYKPRSYGYFNADHPRSRGVYRSIRPGKRKCPGSSPLARGLLLLDPYSPQEYRIIPARAGFTSEGDRQALSNTDHPRSRGVYHSPRFHYFWDRGSSPLARGLLCVCACVGPCMWIIPARAGFTGDGVAGYALVGDHPRSRGVYFRLSPQPNPTHGSSPLARGLRRGKGRRSRKWGIIPARAGFTPRLRTTSRIPWDHPRSRGVYLYGSVLAFTFRGSSPLARGLPSGSALIRAASRIIPARAGFTALIL